MYALLTVAALIYQKHMYVSVMRDIIAMVKEAVSKVSYLY